MVISNLYEKINIQFFVYKDKSTIFELFLQKGWLAVQRRCYQGPNSGEMYISPPEDKTHNLGSMSTVHLPFNISVLLSTIAQKRNLLQVFTE